MKKVVNVVIPDTRVPCKYGTSCYRKNPDHFSHFSHPPSLTPHLPLLNDKESDVRVEYLEDLLFSKDNSVNDDVVAIKQLARELEASVSFLYYHAF